MNKKKFFNKIDFNKAWDENDWELYFQAHDAYRRDLQSSEVRSTPIAKFKFEGSDEVAAFEPVIREYGFAELLSVFDQIHNLPFQGDAHPERDYHPSTDEDPHFWGEGAPLASSLIYRDCCRFAICTSFEIDRYSKRRGPAYRKKHSAELESLKFHANWIAINVAHGHRIGYSEERIRGNIAKCRRALRHADICVSLISRISMRTQSLRLRKELFSFSVQLRNALFSWIDELRLRYS